MIADPAQAADGSAAQGSTAQFGNGKTEHLAQIMQAHVGRPIERLLVVGCGSGQEAAILKQQLRCQVIGIDLQTRFDPRAAAFVQLEYGDATAIRYADAAFDYVYSYHALEHIPQYMTALAEMRRVLHPRGAYCIGTPNRARLIGYLGSAGTTPRQKLEWNVADWKKRLTGKFRNEHGAHAGFGADELRGKLSEVFSNATDVSLEYYLAVYRRHAGKVRALERSGAGRFLFPSIYFVGTR